MYVMIFKKKKAYIPSLRPGNGFVISQGRFPWATVVTDHQVPTQSGHLGVAICYNAGNKMYLIVLNLPHMHNIVKNYLLR